MLKKFANRIPKQEIPKDPIGRWKVGSGLRVAVMALAMVAVGHGSAHAASIAVYTDLASWLAATGTPGTIEDFSDTTLIAGLTVPGSVGLGVDEVSVSCQLCPNSTATIGISPGSTAWGADFDLTPGGVGNGLTFAVTFSDGTSAGGGFIVNPGPSAFIGFHGFVSDTAITSIAIQSGLTGSGETFDMDNMRLTSGGGTGGDGGNNGGGSGTPVPEPATLSLLAIGGALAGRRTRSKE